MKQAKVMLSFLAALAILPLANEGARFFFRHPTYPSPYQPFRNSGRPMRNYRAFRRGAQPFPTNNSPNARSNAIAVATNAPNRSTNALSGTNAIAATKPKPRPRPSLPPPQPKTDTEKAEIDKRLLEFQTKRANDGSPSAQYELGLRYLMGNGVAKDEALGRSWLLKAAQQGNNQAYEKLKNSDFHQEIRDSQGRLVQSSTARKEFMAKSGFPKGRPGYVIEHVVPIARGGTDTPENMQWIAVEEAREKENWIFPNSPAESK